jgi:hypothetical protein
VTSDDCASLQRADPQTSAADGQGNVAASVFHVRGVSQDPLDSPVDLQFQTHHTIIRKIRRSLAHHSSALFPPRLLGFYRIDKEKR